MVTKLRELGFGYLLPLDHNIYIHKFLGWLIFIQAWVHTVMHICNFCKFKAREFLQIPTWVQQMNRLHSAKEPMQ